MNGPDGLPTKNCMNSAIFIRRFALKPTQYTRARGECVPSNFTTEQLAMRRKAEVLQYKNNANFTGALTKAEKYSLVARRKGPNQRIYGTQTQTYTNPNSLDHKVTNPDSLPVKMAYNNLNQISGSFIPKHREKCPIIKISTHSSDVPGPEMRLFMDENVPLTNYIVRRNYSGNHAKSNFIFVPTPNPTTLSETTLFIPSKEAE